MLKNFKKGIVGIGLSIAIIIAMVPTTAFAATSKTVTPLPTAAGSAQGTALKFYDIKVEKQVTDSLGATVKTTLTEIPVPVKIPTQNELDGKSAYSVYRVHGSSTERLPTQARENGEFCEYDDVSNNIVINTRKFSTYGIVGAESSIGDNINEHGGQAVDIQGRVIEGTGGKVYKIDIGAQWHLNIL